MTLCKDCITEGVNSRKPRPAPHPGPRCATHHRAEKKRQSDASHRSRTKSRYGLSDGQYDRLLALQNGACAICKGKRRYRLAVDHDHSCCKGSTSCGKCVRGLLCKNCNAVLSYLRDDLTAIDRIAWYLRFPPGQQIRNSPDEVMLVMDADGLHYLRPGSSHMYIEGPPRPKEETG